MVLQSFQHLAHRLEPANTQPDQHLPAQVRAGNPVTRPTDSAPKTTPRTSAADTHPTPQRPAPNMRRGPVHHTRSARLRRNLEPDKSKAFYLAPRTALSGSRKPGQRTPVDTSHHGDRRALIATAGYPSHTPSNPAVRDVGRRERSVRGEEFIFKEVHCGGANARQFCNRVFTQDSKQPKNLSRFSTPARNINQTATDFQAPKPADFKWL